MGLRAAFFDVGDTLVEGWDPDYRALERKALVGRYGERAWFDAFLQARHDPEDHAVPWRQETLAIIERWLSGQRISSGDVDAETVRSLCCLPLDTLCRLTEGAPEALRWCKSNGLRVVLVTNTLWRGDDEVREDWRHFGLADAIDGVASSHSVGWRKPHPAMFERALALAGARPEEAFMVGDRLGADVLGAQRLEIRAVLRQTAGPAPQLRTDVVPDAVVGSLTELPDAVRPWL
ncbi:MAG TPA: HAD family hydrolase [Candidatus Limnocylindria bacterium]